MSDPGKIEVCHLMGSVGMGGRESLVLDIIENSESDFGHTIVGFRLKEDRREPFEKVGATVKGLNFSSKLDLTEYIRLIRTVRSLSPDILHAHGPNAQLPARFLGVPLRSEVISTHHGVKEMFPDRLIQAETLTRRLDSATVAVSGGVRESYPDSPFGGSWHTIHNGIDVADFSQSVQESDGDSIRAKYDISQEDLVFLNVGRHVAEKRQGDLIDAMSTVTEDHPTARLFIVGGRGGGPERFREQAREAGLQDNVFVTGRVESIHPYYDLADVFVLASTHEGLPIVILEAMTAKLAVVATDIPGVREVVDDTETGLLVPPRKPATLGRAMKELSELDTREQFAQTGYERVVSEFSIEQTASAYEDLYRSIATGSGSKI